MKPKVAEDLFKILKLIGSADLESSILGLTLLQEHSLIKNLSKYYRSNFNGDYPGFGYYFPDHFEKRQYSTKLDNYKINNVRVKSYIQTIINLGQDSIKNSSEKLKSDYFICTQLIYRWILQQVTSRLIKPHNKKNYSKEFDNYCTGRSDSDFCRKFYNRYGSTKKYRNLEYKIHQNDPLVHRSKESFKKDIKKY